MYLLLLRTDDCYGRDDSLEVVDLKEVAAMHDSFSEGGVFYGRTIGALAAIIALAALLQLL